MIYFYKKIEILMFQSINFKGSRFMHCHVLHTIHNCPIHPHLCYSQKWTKENFPWFLIKICWIRLMYFVLRCPHYTFDVFLSGLRSLVVICVSFFFFFDIVIWHLRWQSKIFPKRNIINRTLFWERFTWSMTTSSKLIISCSINLLSGKILHCSWFKSKASFFSCNYKFFPAPFYILLIFLTLSCATTYQAYMR